jgi:DHA1 family inner membrane transport protein
VHVEPPEQAARVATPAEPAATPAAIGALVALSVAAFSYVCVENLPIGLLPLIAADLDRSLSAVGLLVTAYAGTVAVASVPLTRLTLGVPRRRLIAALLLVFVLGSLASAVAANYWMLLAARLATALSQSTFWGVVATTAIGLFPPRVRGRVIAVTFAGASLATVIGVPAGTSLGQHTDWRVSFAALTGLGLLALVTVAALLPDRAPGRGHAATAVSPDARRYAVVLATTMLVVTGVFSAYTYIVAFLTDVSGFPIQAVSPLLLLNGVAGLAGLAVAGHVADRRPRFAMVTPVALTVVALGGLYLAGDSRPATAAFLALSGFALSGVPTAMQSRIMHVAPGSTDVASAGNSAAFNVGVAGGALIGGLLLPWVGVRSTALAGAAIAVVALVIVVGEPLIARGPRGRAGPIQHLQADEGVDVDTPADTSDTNRSVVA